MIEDEAGCIDVVIQINAIQAALQKASALMLDHRLQTCITTALRSDDLDERTQMIGQIMSVFETKGKSSIGSNI